MRYQKSYMLRFGERQPNLVDRFQLLVRGVEVTVHESDPEARTATMTLSTPVSPDGLSVRVADEAVDDHPPNQGIVVPETALVARALRSSIRILSFLMDVPIEPLSHIDQTALEPESKEDKARLEELGNHPPWSEIHISDVTLRAPRVENINNSIVEKLLQREVGLALYTDALRLSSPLGRFRELWRVLESAFGQKGSSLLDSLSRYEPAVRQDFSADELQQLHVLRGRASHAESGAGLEEYEEVTSSAKERVARLDALVSVVLLTKRTWGSKGLAVDRVAPLRTSVAKDGALVFYQSPD